MAEKIQTTAALIYDFDGTLAPGKSVMLRPDS